MRTCPKGGRVRASPGYDTGDLKHKIISRKALERKALGAKLAAVQPQAGPCSRLLSFSICSTRRPEAPICRGF